MNPVVNKKYFNKKIYLLKICSSKKFNLIINLIATKDGNLYQLRLHI